MRTAKKVTVRSGRTATIDITRARSTTQHTRAVAGGERVPDALVLLYRSDRGDEVIAEGRGVVEARGIPAGRYDYLVRVVDPHGTYRDRVALVEDETTLERIAPPNDGAPGSLEGEVAQPGTSVCAVPVRGGMTDRVCAGAGDLDYDIDDLPSGDYKVLYGRRGADVWLGGRSFSTASTVTVTPTVPTRLDIPAEPPTGRLGGDLDVVKSVRSDIGVQVDVFATDDPDEVLHTVRVDSELGREFFEARVPVGEYRLRVSDPTDQYATRWIGGSSHATASTYAVNEGATAATAMTTIPISSIDTTPRFPAPTSFEVTTIGATGLLLDWDENPDVQRYRIEYSTSATMKDAKVRGGRYDGGRSLLRLRPGTRYYLRLVVSDSDYIRRLSPSSPVISATTRRHDELAAPSGVRVARIGHDRVDLEWEPVEGAPAYRIEMDRGKGWQPAPWRRGEEQDGKAVVERLRGGVPHRFRVAVHDGLPTDAGVLSRWSRTVKATPRRDPSIATPRNVRVVAATDTAIDVSWDPVPGATGYVLSYSTDRTFEIQADWIRAAGPTWRITGLRPSTRYYVRVAADDDVIDERSYFTTSPHPSATTPP